MPATIRDMGDANLPLPDFLVADTSLLLGLSPRVAAPRRQQIARSFLKRASQAALLGDLLLMVPLLVMEECYFKLMQSFYEERFGPGAANWHDKGYKQNPQLIGACMPILENFRTTILDLPAVITGPDDLIETPDPPPIALERLMLNIVRDHSLLPKDSYILAEASRLGITGLATMDFDWDRADGFIVYRPN
jgi:hypothetical protein